MLAPFFCNSDLIGRFVTGLRFVGGIYDLAVSACVEKSQNDAMQETFAGQVQRGVALVVGGVDVHLLGKNVPNHVQVVEINLMGPVGGAQWSRNEIRKGGVESFKGLMRYRME